MRIVWRLTFLAVLLSGTLIAEDLTGRWQGVFTRGDRDFRIAIQISKDGPALHGVLLSIDAPTPPVTTNPITQQGSTLTIVAPGIGVTYRPVLSTDGKTMSGPWTQRETKLNLTLEHVTGDAAWPIAETLPPAPTPGRDPKLEVASIKLSRPDDPAKGISVSGHRINVRSYSLTDLITYAFAVHQNQIVGGPAWRQSEHFDITAEHDGSGEPTTAQTRRIMRDLIVDRFGLGFHTEHKELPVYAISVLKSGAKLTSDTTDSLHYAAFGYRNLGSLEVRSSTMDDFAKNIQRIVLDRPVVDRTGLTGKYDFALFWKADEFQFTNYGAPLPPPPDADSRPDLFTAVQQQLGLKLESTRAEVEIIAIDRAEKPSEN